MPYPPDLNCRHSNVHAMTLLQLLYWLLCLLLDFLCI